MNDLKSWYVPVVFGDKKMTVYPLNHRPGEGGMRVYMADQVDAIIYERVTPPMFMRLIGRADGGVTVEQRDTCPSCGGTYFQTETGWQHNCNWP